MIFPLKLMSKAKKDPQEDDDNNMFRYVLCKGSWII